MLNVDIKQSSSGVMATEVVLNSSKRGFLEGFNHGQRLKLCSFLSLYRLLDVLAWLRNIGGKAQVVVKSKPELKVEGLKVWVLSFT